MLEIFGRNHYLRLSVFREFINLPWLDKRFLANFHDIWNPIYLWESWGSLARFQVKLTDHEVAALTVGEGGARLKLLDGITLQLTPTQRDAFGYPIGVIWELGKKTGDQHVYSLQVLCVSDGTL